MRYSISQIRREQHCEDGYKLIIECSRFADCPARCSLFEFVQPFLRPNTRPAFPIPVNGYVSHGYGLRRLAPRVHPEKVGIFVFGGGRHVC